jgi:hypothetical protein
MICGSRKMKICEKTEYMGKKMDEMKWNPRKLNI